MHIDITPSILLPNTTARTSTIFHSNPDNKLVPKQPLIANPYGFAEWFNARTPKEADFANFFEKRSIDFDTMRFTARAPGEEVPNQQPVYQKSRALIALQLLKRWRNVLYERPERAKLRRPPSVFMSKLIGENANKTQSLAEEISYQAACMLRRLKSAHDLGKLVHEVNPACEADVLTDRWPANTQDQQLTIDDLRYFISQTEMLRFGNLPLDQMSKILEQLFGERPAKSATENFIERKSINPSQILPGSGRILAPAVSTVTTHSTARAIPNHNFYGGER